MFTVFSVLSILVLCGCTAGLLRSASQRDGRAAVYDIGFLFLLVLTLYTAAPVLSWFAKGQSYSVGSDLRLLQLQPNRREVAYILSVAAALAITFSLAYRFTIGRRIIVFSLPRQFIQTHIMAGAACIWIAGFVIQAILHVSGVIRTPESYIDSYRVISELSPWVRQLLKMADGSMLVTQVVLLVALCQRWPRHGGWLLVYVLYQVVTFDSSGARLHIVVGLFTLLLAWHLSARPISGSGWLLLFGGGITGFLVIGVWRAASGEVSDALSVTTLHLGELDGIWANTIHILREYEKNTLDISFAVRLGEFVSFIPSQLLPVAKSTLGDWYVSTYYPVYGEQGGGWAFGIMAQIISEGGYVSAVVRGGILGVLAATLWKWTNDPAGGWWRGIVYLYLAPRCFQLARESSFYLLGELLQLVVPTLIVASVIGVLVFDRLRLPIGDRHRRLMSPVSGERNVR